MGDEIPEELRNSPSACKFFFGDMNEEEKRKHVKLLQKCMKALVDNGGTYNGVDDEALKEQIKSLTIATDKSSSPEDETTIVNCLSEEIFLFTLSENPRSFTNGSNATHLLHLKELASSLHPVKTIDLEILEQALFERLLVEDPGSCVINNRKSKSRIDVDNPPLNVIEKECITYLFNCYMSILQKKNEFNPGKASFNILPALETMTNLIIRNVATALKQPELYEESKQELNKQIVSLFSLEEYDAVNLTEFFTLVAKEVEKDEPPGTLLRAFTPTFDLVHKDLAQASILTFPKSHFLLLKIFSTIPLIANVLLIHSTPKDTKLGVAFANTLLGSAFRLSCLPKTPDGMYEYFYKQLSQDVNFNAVEQHLWTSLDLLTELLHGVFLSLLKTCRNQTLNWIGACLDANIHRGKLSAIAAYTPAVFACVSDGFALNLSSVLLRLAEPFIADCDSPKLLRIDPTYTAFMMENEAAANNSGVHMKSLSSETCLLPVEEGNSRPCAKKFSFITECFYMAHRSLDIGLRVVLEHMLSIYKEFVKLQNSMRDAAAQGRSDVSEAIREQMEVIFPRYMSMRCALLEPKNLQLIGKFLSATSIWLIQVVVDNNTDYARESFAPISKKTLSFPLPDHIPDTLKCLPEILLENTASFLVLLKRFATNSFESAFYTVGTDNLQPVLTMLLVFMSSNKRARNPHLRARLAECLECLLPHENETSVLGTYFRSALFKEHPYRKEIVRCLLDVFVGIEMTGESVSFEQKFNYRRPMYAVMSYLWDIPEHKEQFKELSKEAEETMEAVTPPLFLRFLNLLMNDAIFLLDEALTNMAQLRTMQTARENGEWDNLPANERERNNVLLQHIGMTARIDNILGQETIQALEYLSSEIKSIFCHPTMSDRVAAMLNYFLVHLVGPKKKNFKVKDQKEYKFEPATIVINICKIYTHLSDSNEFCAAVSRDGRSYSPQLFQQAQDVLARIGGSALIGDMMTTAERVQKLADILKAEEEVLSDIPDEFLDPIMSTLMSDPVTLPSSRITLDRSTIARHLLSDQSDPFNRSLLTMDMVTSNTELKEKIDKWLKEKKRSHSLMSSNIKDTQPDEPSTSQ